VSNRHDLLFARGADTDTSMPTKPPAPPDQYQASLSPKLSRNADILLIPETKKSCQIPRPLVPTTPKFLIISCKMSGASDEAITDNTANYSWETSGPVSLPTWRTAKQKMY
jgi:hypothetical protein